MTHQLTIALCTVFFLAPATLPSAAAPGTAQTASDDTAALKQTYEAWVTAWNTKDLATIAEIASENFGFGRDVPFPRRGSASQESYRKGLEGYFALMDEVSYESFHMEYRVAGSTGLVWGFYGQTTKQKDGPSRTVYGRQTLTFVKNGGRWRLMMYHRSAVPSEFIR